VGGGGGGGVEGGVGVGYGGGGWGWVGGGGGGGGGAGQAGGGGGVGRVGGGAGGKKPHRWVPPEQCALILHLPAAAAIAVWRISDGRLGGSQKQKVDSNGPPTATAGTGGAQVVDRQPPINYGSFGTTRRKSDWRRRKVLNVASIQPKNTDR